MNIKGSKSLNHENEIFFLIKLLLLCSIEMCVYTHTYIYVHTHARTHTYIYIDTDYNFSIFLSHLWPRPNFGC